MGSQLTSGPSQGKVGPRVFRRFVAETSTSPIDTDLARYVDNFRRTNRFGKENLLFGEGCLSSGRFDSGGLGHRSMSSQPHYAL